MYKFKGTGTQYILVSVSILAFYMHKKTKVNANTFIASDTKGIQTGRERVYVCVL